MVSARNNVILFDDICVLCSRTVRLLMKIDRQKKFRYSSLHGKFADLLRTTEDFKTDDSVIFWSGGVVYKKSEAVIRVLLSLGGLYGVLGQILDRLPQPVLNFFYDFIAKNRYRFFGKRAVCFMPVAEKADLFIP